MSLHITLLFENFCATKLTAVVMSLKCTKSIRDLPLVLFLRVRRIAMRGVRCGLVLFKDIRHDTRCCFNVRSKAYIGQLNLPHETKN